MASFTFPTSPSEGDKFDHAGFEYEWRGDRWAGNGFIGFTEADPTEGATAVSFNASTISSFAFGSEFFTAPAIGNQGTSTPRDTSGIVSSVITDSSTQGIWWTPATGAGSGTSGPGILWPSNLAGTGGILKVTNTRYFDGEMTTYSDHAGTTETGGFFNDNYASFGDGTFTYGPNSDMFVNVSVSGFTGTDFNDVMRIDIVSATDGTAAGNVVSFFRDAMPTATTSDNYHYYGFSYLVTDQTSL